MAENTRRDFIKKTVLGTTALFAYPSARVLGANDRVRIGMIGVGGRGQELLKQILEVPSAQLVAIADVYTRRRDEAKQMAPGIQTLDDHRRLLELNDIDGVIVASPLHIHARHFLDTVAAGKDLYCEKTMTWSIPEAEQCLQAAKTSNRVIQIGLQHESSGALASARKWIKEGLAGKITQVESWMSRNTPHGKGQWVRATPSDCTPANVNWQAFLNGRPDQPFDAYKFINWRLFWEFSGGNVTENMVHQIAWIMSALNLPVPSAAYMSGGIFSEKDGREVPDTIAGSSHAPGIREHHTRAGAFFRIAALGLVGSSPARHSLLFADAAQVSRIHRYRRPDDRIGDWGDDSDVQRSGCDAVAAAAVPASGAASQHP